MTQRVFTFHYTLTDNKGITLDSSRDGDAFDFLEGASQIIPGLEMQLKSLNAGDKKKIQVPAADAYGTRDEARIVRMPKAEMPAKDVEVGQQFQAEMEGHVVPLTVMEVTATEVVLDGNHPLAGVDLTFDVEIVAVRDATAEELQHGHAHGAHGHHHH